MDSDDDEINVGNREGGNDDREPPAKRHQIGT